MRRVDMTEGEIFAVDVDYAIRPGYVLDPGRPPGKVLVKVADHGFYGDRDEMGRLLTLFRDDEIRTKEVLVSTTKVLCPWTAFCQERFDDIDRRHAERIAETHAKEVAKAERHRSVLALADVVGIHRGPDPRSGHVWQHGFDGEPGHWLVERPVDSLARLYAERGDRGDYVPLISVYQAWHEDRAVLLARITELETGSQQEGK